MDLRKILSIQQKNIDFSTDLPDGMLFLGNDGVIQLVNNVACDLFEASEQKLLSRNIDELLENGFNLVINSSNIKKALISKLISFDKYFELTSKSVVDGYVVSFRDATQNYKRISNILEEKENTKLNNNDKNVFLSKLSNKFNSPMQSIVGFSQGLIDGLGGDVNDKQAQYLSIIKKNSCEVLYFFNKLVELSKSEGSLFDDNAKYFDIADIFNYVINNCKNKYTEKILNFDLEIDDNMKKIIFQPEEKFTIIFQNIIESVSREVPLANVKINIRDAQEDFLIARNLTNTPSLFVTISSQNIQINENELSFLFNPYATIDKENKNAIVRAMALGVVVNLLKDLKGVVWVENVPIQGFSFNVVIPREKNFNE